ncbi:MAG TPA: hypothetical protein PKC43_02435 [Phycisphaerales bacterium]|nr:hypothetical protein [Phycisphaerales bacterium]HMP36283.1 hypothetical protein [Phycisphaerales bacterium]
MSVGVSRTKLLGSMKDLQLRWSRIRERWNDEASAHIEESVIGPLEPRLRAAVTAMEKMSQILQRVRKDCE